MNKTTKQFNTREDTHWDSFSVHFEQFVEPSTLTLARALILHLNLSNANSLLEIGCGAGAAALVCQKELPFQARQVVTDFSPEMVQRARARLPEEIEVEVCSADKLPYKDRTFDSVLMNQVLMLTPDPKAVLSEIKRVLCPEGRLAFSVWGRPAHSPIFTLPPLAAKRLGLETTGQAMENFCLGKQEETIELVRAAGFERILAWYQPLVLPIRDGASYTRAMLGAPRMKAFLSQFPESAKKMYIETLTTLADETLAKGTPLSLEALVVLAESPKYTKVETKTVK